MLGLEKRVSTLITCISKTRKKKSHEAHYPRTPPRPHPPPWQKESLFRWGEVGREAAWDIFVGGAFLDVTFLPELARFLG